MRSIIGVVALAILSGCLGTGKWEGLVVAPEDRCSPYTKKDYPHSQALEPVLQDLYGGKLYDPYDKKVYRSKFDTHIEHIVATSEAHDSGLCRASASIKRRFASDLDNLTLAWKKRNIEKSGKDAGEWLPKHNRCWFAWRVVAVKRKYELTVDTDEMAALKTILDGCNPHPMEML